jgi:SAM-dependent methyltransferase
MNERPAIRSRAAYLHVAKCAGTSLTRALVRAAGDPVQPEARLDSCYTFGPHERSDLSVDARRMVLDESLDDRPGEHVFETHWSLPTLRRWFEPGDIATVLREPTMRLLSYVLFAHTRTQAQRRRWYPDDLGARMVRLPLIELLKWEPASRAIDNLVIRQALWGDDRVIGDRFVRADDVAGLSVDVSMQISKFGFAGVIEASEHAVAGLGEWLGAPLDVGHSNRTVDVTYPDLIGSTSELDEIHQLLLDRTAADRRVWAELAEGCGVDPKSATHTDAVASRLRQLSTSTSFAGWSRAVLTDAPIDQRVLLVGHGPHVVAGFADSLDAEWVQLTAVIEGTPGDAPAALNADIAAVDDLSSVDLRALLVGRDFDVAIACCDDSNLAAKLAHELADSVVPGGRLEIHMPVPLTAHPDSEMWQREADGEAPTADDSPLTFTRTDAIASVDPYRAPSTRATMAAMENDHQEPTTDWSRYGEPILLDNPTDSRALVLGLLDGPPQRILELGCSAGLMTQVLCERGHHITGIEIDPEAAALAESSTEQLLVGDLDDDGPGDLLELLDDTYDVVLAADVLEHLRNPLGCLRRAVANMADGGTAILSIPNVAHGDVRLALLAGRFDYRDNGLLDRTHVQLFTLSALVEMIREAGLVPVSWLRSTRPMGTTEVEIDEALFDFGMRVFGDDPEIDTYQWIVTCRRASDPSAAAVWPDLGDNGVARRVGGMLDVTIPRPEPTPEVTPAADVPAARRVVAAARRRVGAILRSVRR